MTFETAAPEINRAPDASDGATIITPQTRETALRGTPLFFRLMANVFDRLSYGSIVCHLPDGRVVKFDSGNHSEETATFLIRNYAVARRSLLGGAIGFYESYEADQWDSPDLAQTLYVMAQNVDGMQQELAANPVVRTVNNVLHAVNKNTKEGSKRNIMAHYDLGNAFYEKWLDPSMTYSSALYAEPGQPLDQAQTEKYASLARRIDLKAGETVLEIGSGWGGFAEFAAREVGARVTGVTISPEQYNYACERMQRAGLNDKVEIRLQDYRDVQGSFDKIASIEMFEAVGKEYWPTYFGKVRENLKSGGLAGLQVITIADHLYPYYEKAADFIQRYVFPGGMLPSPQIMADQSRRAGLSLVDTHSFGQDYAQTLKTWHESFLHAWDDIQAIGFDERFKKLWRYYLAYCEAGFRAGTTDVSHYTLARA
ncbi:SAM-dependent methyltransferase [Aquisalinus flavus]|uniref:Cyclopropane-fatty-acyl-phospholipid synthase n=1 Tax=Aquisalinus flavus TaxID=1526572 RepID=A0A8J2Y4V4_9PROT|nr:cyclopropane-fatty-acyl-phospholipid synthase family protein [Aquisalinus flavus]MBD0427725.1 class I SAM-dependent methyltransferase [Aquisalinus flavus]UNE47503.1 class I SAM-dependent methyltransferase [Aquisalinus flavus]GGD03311.1 cyclopropane-fatty-acyl-phospholipid synthase [Aquisalinus flavus]